MSVAEKACWNPAWQKINKIWVEKLEDGAYQRD
jgi:hypothetical protein